MENINQYVHYYIGHKAEVLYPFTESVEVIDGNLCDNKNGLTIKPILRKLKDLTEEDFERLDGMSYSLATNEDEEYLAENSWLTAESFHYLLQRGYWLWDDSAFDKGLIIDAKTLQP